MGSNTVKLHRVLKSKPEKVFRAFTDADALAKWLPPNGFTCKVHELDTKVGGRYRMSFTNFSTGSSHAFGGEYVEIVENERIRYTDKFEAVSVGTELNIEQKGIPDVIPVEACYLGWEDSLRLLTMLVEPEIPDGM